VTVDPFEDPFWEVDMSPAQAWRARWSDQAEHIGRGAGDVLSAAAQRGQRVALRQGFVVTVAQLRAAGVSRAQSRSLVRSQIWSAPRRGTLAIVPVGGDARVAAALRASAAALTRRDTVISLESAAVLHGLPTRAVPADCMLTIAPGAPDRCHSARLYRAGLASTEVTNWYGAALTTVARTVVDLARRDHGAGLMAADAALREGLTTSTELRSIAVECAGWVGNTAARWVVEHADPLAESPLESLARACLLGGGVPSPQLQAVIRDAGGWSARVDMLWPEQRVIVEVDGRVKYRDDGRSLWREKRRQERLERLGYRVVRILWSDLEREPEVTISRVLAALAS
jgi:very-short-patch-repair endonuclease